MKNNRHLLRVAAVSLLVLFMSVLRPAAAASLEETVEYLIGFVDDSQVTFVRNGSKYPSGEAAAHIRKKYRHFIDRIDTPEKFIELCASRSLVTGREYQVITADGAHVPSSNWMLGALAAYRREHGA